MSSFYRQQLEEWLSQLDFKADRVLDVGGSQLPVKDRVKSWDVREYKIMDLEQPHEGSNKPDMVFNLNDDSLYDIAFPKKEYREIINSFDIVFCLEVMEYIFMPHSALMTIHTLLKKGGLLYITFPSIYPVHEPREQDYLRYTKAGAIKLLETASYFRNSHPSFEILDIIPRTTKQASLRQFYSAEGMRAAKGYDGHEDVGYIIKAQKV